MKLRVWTSTRSVRLSSRVRISADTQKHGTPAAGKQRVIDMRARERPEAAGNCGTQVRGAKRRAGSIPNRKLHRAGTGGKNPRVLALSLTTRTPD